jgi:hypothetical protein
MRTLALLLALLPLPAAAACPNDSAIFSCTIGAKPLQVCHWKGALIYQFGPIDAPELSIAEPVETVAFTPWPGIGRTMWDSVAFQNDGVRYEVYASLEMQLEEDMPEPQLQGGVTVLKGDEILASLTCNEGSVTSFLDTVSTMKAEIGQCFDHATQTWQLCD